MNQEQLLREAIQCARTGDRERAKNFFFEVIELDPENPIAWSWLVDLFDSLEDRIYACEKVLARNPGSLKLQGKYQALLAERNALSLELSVPPDSRLAPLEPLAEAEHLLAEGQREQARKILIPLGKTDKQNERVWLLLSEAVEDEAKQIAALKNALRINPANAQTLQRLEELERGRAQTQENPLALAARYEEEGKYDEAIAALHRATLTIQYGPEFDRIYNTIERLERHKKSGVVHIRPKYSIVRLSFGPPLLYFMLMLVHNRMNPFAFTPLLWLGLLLTIGGGYLLAVANVRARHPIWTKLLDDSEASGSTLARLTVSLAGWLLILISFASLFQSSLERMPLVATNNFPIP